MNSAPSLPNSTFDATNSSSDPPSLPDRPNTLNSVVNQTASNYSAYGQNRLGASAYGGGYGGAGYSSYSSPYSRLGGMGSMYGGGMGSMYGGGYGGMGGGMYGGGYGGMPGQPGDQNSLTNAYNQSTQATFQTIESIVGAFGGFAQMLESTYMATHSSFFGVVPDA
jgi:peroxin-13